MTICILYGIFYSPFGLLNKLLLLKNMVPYFPINDCAHWIVKFIRELLDIQNSNMFIDLDQNACVSGLRFLNNLLYSIIYIITLMH